MSRRAATLLTILLAVYSYFEIGISVPLLTASIPARSGATAPVSQVIGPDLYISLLLQILLAVLLLSALTLRSRTSISVRGA